MKYARLASYGLWRFLAVSLGLHLLLLLGINADHSSTLPQISAASLKMVLAGPGHSAETAMQPADKSLRRELRSKPRDAGGEQHSKSVPAEAENYVALGGALSYQAPVAGANSNADMVDAGAPASPPRDAVSADAVRQYVLLLVPEARRLKRYPMLARERGWEGTVEITVKLGKTQAAPSILVTRSSGFTVLDEQAEATIGQAVRLVPVPDSLRGKDAVIAVPIRFSLQD